MPLRHHGIHGTDALFGQIQPGYFLDDAAHGFVINALTWASSASTFKERKYVQTFLMSLRRYDSPFGLSYSVVCEKSMKTGCSSLLRMLKGDKSAWTSPALWSFLIPVRIWAKNSFGCFGVASLSFNAMSWPEVMHSSTSTLFI